MSTASKKLIPRLQLVKDIATISNRLLTPGFATHALRLGPSAITPETLSLKPDKNGDDVMTLRYAIPKGACRRGALSGDGHGSGGDGPGGGEVFTLSRFLAVVDEVTTWALISADSSRRPGLSLALHAELGPAGLEGRGIKAGDVVDIETKVVKIGRNIGFVNAEVVEVASGDIVCVATHTKFMPMSLSFRIFMGPLFPLVRWIASFGSTSAVAIEDVNPDLDGMLKLCRLENDSSKHLFHADHRHRNPAGVIHGGCQAVLMELSGHPGAAKELRTCSPELQSISISFVSAAKNEVTIDSGWICSSRTGGTTKVVVTKSDKCQVVAEGFLKWSKYE